MGNNDLVQATPSAQPTPAGSGNDQYISFDGGDSIDKNYASAISQPFQRIVCVRNNAATANIAFMDNLDTSYCTLNIVATNKARMTAGNPRTSANDNSMVYPGTFIGHFKTPVVGYVNGAVVINPGGSNNAGTGQALGMRLGADVSNAQKLTGGIY
jgi:hypothetical protein